MPTAAQIAIVRRSFLFRQQTASLQKKYYYKKQRRP